MFNTARILNEHYDIELLVVDDHDAVTDDARDALAKRFDDVHWFTASHTRFRANAVQGVFSRRPLQTHYFTVRGAQDWVDANVERFDLCYCNHVRTTEYVLDLQVPVVVDLVDAISRNYARSNRGGLWRLLGPVESRRLRRYERYVIEAADHCFISTHEDWRYVDPDGDYAESVSVLPNGVRPALIERPICAGDDDTVAFLGKMDYYPNVEAARFFTESVLPILHQYRPDLTFTIVGANPTRAVRALGDHPGVHVTGFVEAPETHLERAGVIVAPLQSGTGLQNKVLEAMALGKAVVTTGVGREGIAAEEGIHLMIADEPETFAIVVDRLLDNRQSRTQMGRRAREMITEQYTWDATAPILHAPIEKILS